MFRAAVLFIVLTLTTGSTASLLCPVWCDAARAKAECQHCDVTASPRVTDETGCRSDSAATTAIVREGSKRGWPTSGVPQLVPVSWWLEPATTEATSSTNESAAVVHARPHRLTTLRI